MTGHGQRATESLDSGAAPRLHIEFDDETLPPNQAPQVDAGLDQTVVLPNSATLDATVTDDGQLGPLTTSWTKFSGPGTVSFDDPSAVDTVASFSVPGTYVLRLTAADGEFVTTDDATIVVAAPGSEVLVLDVNVSAGAGDVEESGAGVMDATSKDLDLARRAMGLRFDGVAIHPGATILDAYIQFQADESHTEPTFVTLAGEAADRSSAFTDLPFNVTSRSTTLATVHWSVPNWTAAEEGLNQRTPNISAIVQEIVSRPGWASGNPLTILLTGTGHRAAESFESGAAPRLHIEFDDETLPPNQPPQVDAGADQARRCPTRSTAR